MLVLTRKLKQQIKIGDNITVTVLAVRGGAIRIGIDAPREVRVVREELPALSPAELEASSGPAKRSSPPSVRTPAAPQRSSETGVRMHADGLRRFIPQAAENPLRPMEMDRRRNSLTAMELA